MRNVLLRISVYFFHVGTGLFSLLGRPCLSAQPYADVWVSLTSAFYVIASCVYDDG